MAWLVLLLASQVRGLVAPGAGDGGVSSRTVPAASSIGSSRAWRNEARDAEARGLVSNLAKAAKSVLPHMAKSARLDAEAARKAADVESAEAAAVAAALHVATVKQQMGAAWEPTAWRDATDETSQRLAALYEEGLAVVKKREEAQRKLKAYQARQRIINLYEEGKARVAAREATQAAYATHVDAQAREAQRTSLLGEIHGSWQVDTGYANPRLVELLPDGKVEIQTARGEFGKWALERVRGKTASIKVSLFMTPAPSMRCKEHVFKGVVKHDFAVASECGGDLPWSMHKMRA